ncbi:hypothetical protein EVAR_60441_1 [Eumeta japonica]|uniref:Uncharacterized protein n=1 Tax=Eumeta variegata TaxID=151549 RepID=A0A4C1Z196_EUMVA|nr:hypothetical protein EVAR_60441_1 [Eumeta japonica]
MSKVLKSFFPSNEKRISTKNHDNEITEDHPLPLDSRRKLSISRSGKMKQTNKKRHTLSPDLYGNFNTLQMPERQSSMEYHVHSKTFTEQIQNGGATAAIETEPKRPSGGATSPEEEIDSAFEVIDKPND